jgi:catecholate siderophore receptor
MMPICTARRTLSQVLTALILLVHPSEGASTVPPAQGSIEVRVLDQSGAAVIGAEVFLRRDGRSMETLGGSDLGVYRSRELPVGRYVITIARQGFAPTTHEVAVEAARVVTVSVTLVPQGVSERVLVESPGLLAPPPVLSGTRTAIQPLDLPQSVDVVSQTVIRSQSALSMQDALANVAGVTPQMGEGRRDQFTIRGFSAVNDTYIDGVRDDAKYYRDLSNLEQVEVVKGPAGALFGRGSSGGVINRVTKKPVFGARVGDVSIVGGSYDRRRLQMDYAEGRAAAPVAFRVTGAAEEGGSQRPSYAMDRWAVAPSIAFRSGSGAELMVQAEFLHDNRVPDRGIPTWQGTPLDVARDFYYGFPDDDFLRNDVRSQAATWQQAFGGRWALRNVFRHTSYDNRFSNTFSGTVREVNGQLRVSRSQYNVDADQRNIFNQLDLTTGFMTGGIGHAVLVGMELGRETTRTARFTGTADEVDVIAPVLTRPVYGVTQSTDNAFTGTTAGVYAQDQLAIGNRWRALVGGRFDSNEQSLDDRRAVNVDLARHDYNFSPRAGVVFRAVRNTSLYSSVSRSFQPSGDGLSLAVNNAELEPEQSVTYEAGVKSEVFRRRLTVTGAVFRLDRYNVKTIDPFDPARLVLVGKQRSDGVEFTAGGALTRRWDLSASLSLLDPVILRSNDVSSGVAVEGKRIGNVANRSASLWTMYALPRGVSIGGGLFYLGDRFAANDNLVRLDGYLRVDSVVAYRIGHYEVQVNVKNLFDEEYYETAHSNTNVMPAAGRNGLVAVRYRW